jgi:hypothetical protein
LRIVAYVRFANAVRARALPISAGITVIAALGVGSQETAYAAAEPAASAPMQLFGVHPAQEGRTTLPGGHFNFALVPRQRIGDAIVVENFSDHPLRVQVYGADLLTATGGGLAPAQPTATMREVGAWIAVAVPAVTIAAHESFTDRFTVTVPPSVSSGEHLGAVVAAADVGVTPQGNPIEARAALIVVVTVPGVAEPSARLTPLVGSDATAGQVGFGITLANTGNVLLTYTGLLLIDDSNGHRVATLSLTPTTAYVVPRGQLPLAAVWKEPAPPGEIYRAQATVIILADGKPVRTLTSQALALRLSSSVPAFVPIALALVIAALVVLAAWIARDAGGRRRKAAALRVRGTGSVA